MAIFQKNNNWYIDYYYEGRRFRELVGPSAQLAKEVLNKRKLQIAENKFFPERINNTKTFGEILSKYWDLHGKYFKSPSWTYYKNEIEKLFGARAVDSINTLDIQCHYNNVRGRSSISNANRQLTFIKAVFNKANIWGDYHKDNPCLGISKNRESTSRLRYLTQDEMGSLLNSCSDRLRPLILCALLTGMRRGELLSLNWFNVSLERGIIYLLKTKSGKSREIPIPGKLHEILQKIHVTSGSVFGLTAQMLRKDFKEAIIKAKIDPQGFKFHDLRHTYASYFIMKTNDLPALQALLGHSSPSMTQRYAHLSKSHLVSEIALFETAIPNNGIIPKSHILYSRGDQI